MKTQIFKLLIIIGVVCICSCNESDNTYQMYTRINADGSCYREFVRKTDSAFIAGDTSKNPFPMKIDSNWAITYSNEKNSLPDKFIGGWPIKNPILIMDSLHHLVAKASRKYTSIKELTNTFTFNNIKWKTKIIQNNNLNNKFRWFYTYYEYTEVFKKINPNPNTKITDFLTNEEISYYFGENTDFTNGKNGMESLNYLKDLEKKGEQWQLKCIYDAYFEVLIKDVSLFKELKIDSNKFKTAKEPLFKNLKDEDVLLNDDSTLFNQFDKYFKTKIFSKEYNNNKVLKQNLKQAGENALAYYPGTLYYNLSVPGKIIETNSSHISGDTLTWKINAERFFFNDYKLYVISRKPNYWSFAVTGVMVLLIILSFLVKRKRN